MKKIIITVGILFLIFGSYTKSYGQINRTTETAVADILAQLPTNDLEHSNKLMQEIIELKAEGILLFCDRLVPAGTGDDTKARFAIQSLAVYSGGQQDNIENSLVEDALLTALENSKETDVKKFLIERLQFCGSNSSVDLLKNYLNDEKLYKSAIASLSSIATDKAVGIIFSAAEKTGSERLPAFIDALGSLKYKPAVGFLQKSINTSDSVLHQKSLMALANIASDDSFDFLTEQVKKSNYKIGNTKAILAYIIYGNRLSEKGNKSLSSEVANNLLKNCSSEDQLSYRSAGIQMLRMNEGTAITKTLIKEAKNENLEYRASVFHAASQNISQEEVLKWVKAYKKASNEAKPQFLLLLRKRKENEVFNECIVPAVNDKDRTVRISGIKALVYQNKEESLPIILSALEKSKNNEETLVIKESLLKIVDADDNELLVKKLNGLNTEGKIVIIEVLATRGAKDQFETITELLNNGGESIDTAIYAALPYISTSDNLIGIIDLLNSAKNEDDIKNAQKAVVHILDNVEDDHSKIVLDAYNNSNDKNKLLPVMYVLENEQALILVGEALRSDSEKTRTLALETLSNWRNKDAIPYLFKEAAKSTNDGFRAKAFNNYLSQVLKSSLPDDQKLLLVKKLLPFSKNKEEVGRIISSAGRIKTFLSLVFVSKYLDSNELSRTASYAAIRIALPEPGKKNGLSGNLVKEIVSKSIDNLAGPESQYTKIDVNEFLDNLPNEKGFVSIFNGKDLSGWEGLVKNPIERNKMSKKTLEKEQIKSNEQMLKDWFVKDGIIGFKGEGYNNICTIKDYGDFEMLVDWKITNGGDSGIYLRGTPQVQIWDIARVDVGAQVGSGGLYNNKSNEDSPLVVADNPINDWNTFRIKMVGERVTVHLNGVLVTDNVILENYWDNKLPIFTEEAIELQAHGEDLGFRNIYVREINSGDDKLSDIEKAAGFKSLFNGRDLDQWIGNKKDYFVENNELVVRPKQGGHGNLFTSDEYTDFIFRFEFKLSPGANNGLGIHAPLEGDVAYVGKELQILDNTASIYANLKEYQYHGSVYGVIAAKRGFLNPVGEWNYEEVMVQGDHIKITLNGTVILEGNFKEASKDGTLDGKDHPGLKRNKGHIGFLGHGSELQFRNIRIKDLSK